MKTLYVLWVLYTASWQIGPIPMTEGWFATKPYSSLAECVQAAVYIPHPWACVSVENDPPGELAEVIR